MKKLYIFLVAVSIMFIMGCGSRVSDTPLSSAKAITAFNITSPVAATGVITESTHTIAITVPFGTVVSALVPTITHTGASINPATGVANNFTNPVIYTVTAADGSTQPYTVTVTISPLSGSLDTTFGTSGMVTTPIGSSDAKALALAIQSDGKIVAAGSSYNGSNNNFALVRYNTDGSLDSGFGTGGIVTTPIGSGDVANAIGIQSDNKIVVAGYSYNGSNYDFALVRYNTNGTLDTTFGSGGIVTTPIGSGDDVAYALGIQPDNKIVVAGYSYGVGLYYYFALVRYNTNGTLDTTFGSGGIVTTPIGSGYDIAYALGLQPDNKIVVAGSSYNGSNKDDFALARFNTDGTLDATFGTNGIVTTSIGSSYDQARALGIQPSDNKIVVAGSSYNGSKYNFALVRYNADGSLDSGFGTGGIVTTSVGSDWDVAYALGIQPSDNKIVVAGSSGINTSPDFAVVRYNANGTLDTGFGSSGIVTTPIGSSDDYAIALGIQSSDGKIVITGYSYNGSNYDFALVRYLP